MNISDRVKQVRSELGLTQIEFRTKTGISQSHLTAIESGKRVVTEKTLKVICATFNVSEEWLRTGEGEMFVENDNVLLSQLSKQYDLDAFSRKFIEAYISLPQSHRDVIKNFALSLVEAENAQSAPEVVIAGNKVDDPEIASELSVIAKELEQEKRVVEKSSASRSANGA